MIQHITRLFLLLAVTVLLASCSAPRPSEEELTPAAMDFTQRLRWKDLNGAARHMVPEAREDFLPRFRELEDLKIVDVVLESIDVGEEDRATSWVVMEYYLLPSITVKKLRFQLEWIHFSSQKNRSLWLISSPFPPFP
jgi:hypothetical protein